jgi:hypothetical protein
MLHHFPAAAVIGVMAQHRTTSCTCEIAAVELLAEFEQAASL